MQIQPIKLHDIQPVLEVNEFSIYYFSTIMIVVILLLSYLVYKIILWIKSRNKYNKRKSDKYNLINIDLTNTKEAAYAIGLYGFIFKDDSDRHNEIYTTLQEHLAKYKYKKEVSSFDDKTLSYYDIYKEMCDV